MSVSELLVENQSHNDVCKHFMLSGHQLTMTASNQEMAHSPDPLPASSFNHRSLNQFLSGMLELGVCIHLWHNGFLHERTC
jgi:hypothetical protein